ncbi:hypothetical protein [Brachybacterium huguangmaarense]
MNDTLQLLAEGSAHASEGVSPFLVGGAFFVGFMVLLLITYLFSGMNQRHMESGEDLAVRHDAHGRHDGHGHSGSASHRSH